MIHQLLTFGFIVSIGLSALPADAAFYPCAGNKCRAISSSSQAVRPTTQKKVVRKNPTRKMPTPIVPRKLFIPKTKIENSVNNPTDNSVVNCTEARWDCTAWSACAHGIQTRNCEMDYRREKGCLNPEKSHPIETQNCTNFSLSDLEKWAAFHDEIIEAAKELTRQGPSAKSCFSRIAEIEGQFVKYYNSCNTLGESCEMLETVKDAFDAAPKVCF